MGACAKTCARPCFGVPAAGAWIEGLPRAVMQHTIIPSLPCAPPHALHRDLFLSLEYGPRAFVDPTAFTQSLQLDHSYQQVGCHLVLTVVQPVARQQCSWDTCNASGQRSLLLVAALVDACARSDKRRCMRTHVCGTVHTCNPCSAAWHRARPCAPDRACSAPTLRGSAHCYGQAACVLSSFMWPPHRTTNPPPRTARSS